MAAFPFLSARGDDTLLELYVQPGAAKNELAGVREGRLKVRINAPPAEGEANRGCIGFLSKTLGVPKSEIALIRGEKNRNKTLLIGRSLESIAQRLDELGVKC